MERAGQGAEHRPGMSGTVTMDTTIEVTREPGIVTLTLNGAPTNRLLPATLEHLARIVAELERDGESHVVIITGAGTEFFSSGVLSPAIRAELPKESIVGMLRWGNRLFDHLEALPQIVIAALNGEARAGAAELSLACDIRIAAAHAKFSLPEAEWGGFPGGGAPVRLPAIVGRANALHIMCATPTLGAEEMKSMGLVQAVHPSSELLVEATLLARRIVANGPLAIRGAKRIVHTRLTTGFHAARQLSDEMRTAVEYSKDVDEATAAHAQGRPPRFTGR